MSVELQIRTKLQHTWATAVETMGTFLGQALKAREGPEQWLRFFEVTGSAFAYLEKSPQVPGYEKLSKWDTFARVQAAERELAALDKLSAFTAAVDPITEPGKKGVYHLIVLDSSQRPIRVHIRPYAKTHLRQAVNDYSETEKRASNGELIEAVLVAAGPVAEMRKAYPNYFLDTNDFVIQVRNIIEAITKRRGTIGEFWDSAEYLQTAASFIHSVLGDR